MGYEGLGNKILILVIYKPFSIWVKRTIQLSSQTSFVSDTETTKEKKKENKNKDWNMI